MLLLHFTELGSLSLPAKNRRRAVGVGVSDSEGDISDDVRSLCGLDSSELCVVAREKSLRLLEGKGEPAPAVVEVALLSAHPEVLVDAPSFGPKAVVGRDVSESAMVSAMLERATLTGDRGLADDGGRVVLEGVDGAPE